MLSRYEEAVEMMEEVVAMGRQSKVWVECETAEIARE